MTDTTKFERCCRGNKELLIIQFTCMQLVFTKIIRFFIQYIQSLFLRFLAYLMTLPQIHTANTLHGPNRSDSQNFGVRLSPKYHLQLLSHSHRTPPFPTFPTSIPVSTCSSNRATHEDTTELILSLNAFAINLKICRKSDLDISLRINSLPAETLLICSFD